jgi:hypothetical protein
MAVARSFVLCAVLVGCGKTMTEGDCERVGKHLGEVWDSEVAATQPMDDAPKSDRAKLVLGGERERMKSEWMTQCKRELDGRKVDDKELECLMASKTVADIQGCATPKKK